MRKFGLVSLVASLVILAVPAISRADTSNFIVTNFSADYYLNKSDPQGAMTIDEQITVNFNDYNHGILRALPEKYNGLPQHLHIIKVERDGNAEPYDTSTSNGNEVLKIGNANSTITGQHTYNIDYSVKNVIRFTGNQDELDWNTNGTQWDQPFEHITARLHVPLSLSGVAETGSSCFVGVQGSTAQDCTVDATNNQVVYSTNRALDSSENMTFEQGFKLGTFTKSGFKDWLNDYGTAVVLAVTPPVLTLLLVGGYWYKNGKDLKGRGTIIPEYGPPNNLKPAEVDTVVHYKPGKNAISATIIDLAIRKYLKIQESKSNGLLGVGKHNNYTFVRLPEPAKDTLSTYETQVMNGLFAAGDTVEMASLKKSFYTTVKAVQKQLTSGLTAAGYFSRDPSKSGTGLHIVGIVLIFGSFQLFSKSTGLALGLLVSGLMTLLFGSLMTRRTQKGVDAKDAIEGLKLYMNTAEKDRLQMLQSVDARYAPQSAEPVKTVQLFEKLLPYAMVLGVEKSWGKQFESIYTTPPDWYGGNWATFNAIYFTNSLSNSMSAMNSSFAAPSSAGSGTGGGFSGGGGGGGGGGGW